MKRKRLRQRNIRYMDPGVMPLGRPKPIGIGTVAKVVVETRQLRRARSRAAQTGGDK